MLTTRWLPKVLAVCTLLTFGAGLAAGFDFWTNKDGTGDFFEWRDGGSDHGLFGDPILVNGNTFVFFPDGFRAQSVNGVLDVISDRMEVELIASPGYMFTDVLISEYGDYGIFDEGMVAVTGSLFVTRLNDEFKVLSDDLVSDPPSPIDSGHGTWTGEVGIDLSAQFPVWTRLKLVLDDNLIALSAPGSISFIEKKVLGAGLSITIIPEPASLILLLGGVALIRRYR